MQPQPSLAQKELLLALLRTLAVWQAQARVDVMIDRHAQQQAKLQAAGSGAGPAKAAVAMTTATPVVTPSTPFSGIHS